MYCRESRRYGETEEGRLGKSKDCREVALNLKATKPKQGPPGTEVPTAIGCLARRIGPHGTEGSANGRDRQGLGASRENNPWTDLGGAKVGEKNGKT